MRLAGVFGDNAVLQRDVPVSVWGLARPRAAVKVSFAGQEKSAKADGQGRWRVVLDPMMAAKTPRPLVVSSSEPKEELRIRNVLVGDVWLCSGQSNMGVSMGWCIRGRPLLEERVAEANNPLLRLGQKEKSNYNQHPKNDACTWRVTTPESTRSFSAIGYLFGDQIQRDIGIPVGVLNHSVGGSYIQQWLSPEQIEALPACGDFVKRYHEAVAEYPQRKAEYEAALARGEKPKRLRAPKVPSQLYKGMLEPVVPFPLKGVLWYQGEGNVWQFGNYDTMMVALIRHWRELWKQPELPFIMTELAPYNPHKAEPHDSARCRFGVTLAKAAETAGNAWTITITDGGEQEDIHPRYKDIPAERFAAMALAKVYGKGGVCHGPVLESWKAEDGKAILTFSSVEKGLEARNVTLDGHELSADKLVGFEIADAKRRFFRADAEIIDGSTVVVSHPEVAEPAAVRYAWGNFPLCNLYNQEGFAAYPFRTDDWPWMTPK